MIAKIQRKKCRSRTRFRTRRESKVPYHAFPPVNQLRRTYFSCQGGMFCPHGLIGGGSPRWISTRVLEKLGNLHMMHPSFA